MRPHRELAALAVLLCGACACTAGVIRVPGDMPTIQSGITAASPGDTVLVACGLYYEHGIVMQPGVCLRSVAADANCAIIDAQQQGRVMDCHEATADTEIKGFTFTGGLASYSGPGWAPHLGGGVRCMDSIEGPIFTDCAFVGNVAETYGGGVHCGYSGTPVFRRCRFVGNTAGHGGGAFLGGWQAGTNCSPRFERCVFEGNMGGDLGGACSVSGYEMAKADFQDCTFVNNTAENGGALHVVRTLLSAKGCLFAGNNASSLGGALRLYQSPAVEVTGCTFVANDCQWGGTILLSDSGIAVDRTIVAFSVRGAALMCNAASEASLTCSDVYGNEGGDWVGCVAGQGVLGGNFSLDPLFCGDQFPMSPYALEVDSPCAPGNNGCGVLIGCRDVECGSSAVEALSWGELKARYRQ
jgi:predicted outer membrane repeat protein